MTNSFRHRLKWTIPAMAVSLAMLAPPGGSKLAKVRTAFETPLIPSVIIGLSLRGFEVELPTPLITI